MVISCAGEDTENNVSEYLKENVKKMVIKSKTVSKDGVELNYEVRLIEENTKFINALANMHGVNNAVLVSYNGEYMN